MVMRGYMTFILLALIGTNLTTTEFTSEATCLESIKKLIEIEGSVKIKARCTRN